MVDGGYFLGRALQTAFARNGFPLQVNLNEPSWFAYTTHIEEIADFVILDSNLSDHVPTLLKIRAIKRAGGKPIIIGQDPNSIHAARIIHEGGHAILGSDSEFRELVQILRSTLSGATHSRNPSSVQLSDRELQCAALFASDAAPSASVISSLLGISHASTRTHIQRARTALREVGETSSRRTLRETLVADGWVNH